jgi:BlaI family transcriptional regulator, penicillinase repressor
VKGYFNGSAINMVSQFVKDENLSIEEMEDLPEKLRSAKRK